MMMELLIPLGAFVFMAAVVGQMTRLLSDISLNRTLRDALRSHPDSVPLLAQRLGVRQPAADGLLGWMLIALAVEVMLVAMFETADDRNAMLQIAIIPAVVGITTLAYLRWTRRDAV